MSPHREECTAQSCSPRFCWKLVTEGASVFKAEVTRSAKHSGRPHACTRGRVSLDGSCPTTLPASFFPASVRDFLAQACGRCYFPSPTHSDWNRDQDSLRVCFLGLGNAWSLLPYNIPAVSFIQSCPGKCLIHSCRRPTAGRARHSEPREPGQE